MTTEQIVNAEDAVHLLSHIAPIEALFGIARLQGRMRYRWGKHGRVVHDNLKQTFGDIKSPDEIERMSRAFFEYERIRSLILTLAPRMDPDALSQLLPMEGEAYLDEALSLGKGVILLGSHLNSVAMFAAIIMWRKRGYDITVALPDRNDAWGRTLLGRGLQKIGGRQDTIREAIGGFYGQFNVRPIVERLRKNFVVGQTGDGWHSANYVEVDFLDRKIPFTTGSWSIAHSCGAAVIPMYIPGAPGDDLRIILDKPVVFDPKEDKKTSIAIEIAKYANRLEGFFYESIPAWQHWLKPNALDAMVQFTERTLEERYEVE